MSSKLSHFAQGRDNNFNLLRFIAASLVLYTHSFVLVTGIRDSQPLRSHLEMTWGSIAVDVFFVTSGFLICSSFLNRNNLLAFIWARVLRIFPALFVAVFLTVFVLGPVFTELHLGEYFSSLQVYKYFLKNISLFAGVDHQLPGVFTNLPFANAVNGSLWTLPYEVRMYALLAILLSLAMVLKRYFSFVNVEASLLFVAVLALLAQVAGYTIAGLSSSFLRLFSMFFVGAAFYVYRQRVTLSHTWFSIAVIALLASAFDKQVFHSIYYLLLPYIILYLAYVPGGKIRKFNALGDYSYGMYIYAYPVQQATIALIPDISIASMILVSFVVTLALAILSWSLIEKRALALKGQISKLQNVLNLLVKKQGAG